MFEASATTGASIFLLGVVGYTYTKYYNHMVLEKIGVALEEGGPILELAAPSAYGQNRTEDQAETALEQLENDRWIPRKEQERIDRIVCGAIKGRYHLIMGEKGTGKSSMLIDAMAKVGAEGVVMMEAHADPEIFRIRLGQSLNFDFHEDNIGALFSIRGPRDASALLDIERAFNKLEKAALLRRQKIGRPLVLIINSAHLIQDDDQGRNLLELIQQRAEQWAAVSLATIIINTDKYWVYERLKQYSSRMEVTFVEDLPKDRAIQALRNYRLRFWNERTSSVVLEEVYDRIGGRLSFLSKAAKTKDMIEECSVIEQAEMVWFLTKCCILGEEMDDDVMDQQKFAASAMVLAKHLCNMQDEMDTTYHPREGFYLPKISLHSARYVMTRADFIRPLHNMSIFSIDANALVSASSIPMQRAMNTICSEPGFDKFLEATLERIGDIESLGRTRELTLKDPWNAGRYKITLLDQQGDDEHTLVIGKISDPSKTIKYDDE